MLVCIAFKGPYGSFQLLAAESCGWMVSTSRDCRNLNTPATFTSFRATSNHANEKLRCKGEEKLGKLAR
jgi:hypothetical protein